MNLIDGEVVLALEVARIRCAIHASERLVVSSVGHETSDGTVASGVGEDFFEDWGDLGKVVGPS